MIDNGNLIAEGTSDQLKARIGGDVLEMHLEDSSQLARAADTLSAAGFGETTIDEARPSVRVGVESAVGTVARAVRQLDAAGVALADISIHRPTLDDVFLTLTGRDAHTEQPGTGASRSRSAT